MNAIAEPRASTRALWESLPLEVPMAVFAVILAGGLKWAGIMP